MISEKMAKSTVTAQQFLEKISDTLDTELATDLDDLLKLKQEVWENAQSIGGSCCCCFFFGLWFVYCFWFLSSLSSVVQVVHHPLIDSPPGRWP
jgi:hypothetical protein